MSKLVLINPALRNSLKAAGEGPWCPRHCLSAPRESSLLQRLYRKQGGRRDNTRGKARSNCSRAIKQTSRCSGRPSPTSQQRGHLASGVLWTPPQLCLCRVPRQHPDLQPARSWVSCGAKFLPDQIPYPHQRDLCYTNSKRIFSQASAPDPAPHLPAFPRRALAPAPSAPHRS